MEAIFKSYVGALRVSARRGDGPPRALLPGQLLDPLRRQLIRLPYGLLPHLIQFRVKRRGWAREIVGQICPAKVIQIDHAELPPDSVFPRERRSRLIPPSYLFPLCAIAPPYPRALRSFSPFQALLRQRYEPLFVPGAPLRFYVICLNNRAFEQLYSVLLLRPHASPLNLAVLP